MLFELSNTALVSAFAAIEKFFEFQINIISVRYLLNIF